MKWSHSCGAAEVCPKGYRTYTPSSSENIDRSAFVFKSANCDAIPAPEMQEREREKKMLPFLQVHTTGAHRLSGPMLPISTLATLSREHCQWPHFPSRYNGSYFRGLWGCVKTLHNPKNQRREAPVRRAIRSI